jgi:hypothetical protein
MDGKIGEQELSDTAWETRHSVEVQADVDFAWRYWTDVKNWDDPPARFEFVDPFVEGARGLTRIPGQPPIEWYLRNVKPGATATIEIPADKAAMSFEWTFESAGEGRTRLTQRIVLRGENAENYLDMRKRLRRTCRSG